MGEATSFSCLICTVSDSTKCSRPSSPVVLAITQEGGRGMTLLAPHGWPLLLPGLVQVIPQAWYLPTSPLLVLALSHVCQPCSFPGRSQVLRPQPCFSRKSLCAEGSASPGVSPWKQAASLRPSPRDIWVPQALVHLLEGRPLGLCVLAYPHHR